MLYIGFDDTDSRHGMCTTYLAYRVVDFLLKSNAKFLDYPLLIRLNPNIPWKTRGNGAVSLRVEADDEQAVMDGVKALVENGSHIGSGANPGLAFYSGSQVPTEITGFAAEALYDVLGRKRAAELARKYGVELCAYGNGQGVVGALAAVGTPLNLDHTFECIAYRKEENCGGPRPISSESVREMAVQTYPHTYNSYDHKHERVLIAPHGPDPIFCGIRGEDPNAVLQAFLMLEIPEELAGYMIFRTNHGTNAHLANKFNLANLKTYTSGFVEGYVDGEPRAMMGGHTFFRLRNEQGSALCAVYEPTGLSPLAQRLSSGDLVEIGGGVRKATSKHPKVINAEYIHLLKVAAKLRYLNPLCSRCSRRMKSEGKGKGYQCEHCGHRERGASKVAVSVPREIKEDLYIPVPKAHRHLTKPQQRYGMEKNRFVPVLDSRWYRRFVSPDLASSALKEN